MPKRLRHQRIIGLKLQDGSEIDLRTPVTLKELSARLRALALEEHFVSCGSSRDYAQSIAEKLERGRRLAASVRGKKNASKPRGESTRKLTVVAVESYIEAFGARHGHRRGAIKAAAKQFSVSESTIRRFINFIKS